MLNAVKSGKFFTSAGDAVGYYNSRDDFAEVAAHILAADDLTPYKNQRVHISGAEPLTQAAMVQTVRDVAGIPLELVQVSDEQLIAGMTSAGLPERLAQIFATFDTGTRAGVFGGKHDEIIQRLTGHAPTTWRQFVEARKEMLKQ